MSSVPQGYGAPSSREISLEAERLAKAYIAYFYSADHSIKWYALESEFSLWLSANTLLVGRVDGIGETADGRPFFKEDKTASKWKAAKIKDEKIRWRMAPQALTYGVLLGAQEYNAKPYTADSEINPLRTPVRTFTTRWVFKTDPATCDFEWYTYTEAEIAWWRGELNGIAHDIRYLRSNFYDGDNWDTNLNHCTRYGKKYPCPFRDVACHQLNFSAIPERMSKRTESHLRIENTIVNEQRAYKHNPDLVILDATRVADWINCHELYRRMWEGDGLREESEALEVGGDFHSLINAHTASIMSKRRE